MGAIATHPKLIIVPGTFSSLGGTVTALSNFIKGLFQCGLEQEFCVLVPAESLLERYLLHQHQSFCLHSIAAQDSSDFLTQALQWVKQQPITWPLWLEGTAKKSLLLPLARAIPSLRWSGRPVYHYFHDSAQSFNLLGVWSRKAVFTGLAPVGICNSRYTAQQLTRLAPNLQTVLYPPIDYQRFSNPPYKQTPPPELQAIREAGKRILFNPSRITQPGIMNDKNHSVLIPMMAYLKTHNYPYHLVLMGKDNQGDYVQQLKDKIQQADLQDWVTILPPCFDIENYYRHVDVLVTLAPREPFGMIVAEAIAASVPVVGSQTGGIGEILGAFAPEWSVDPADPVAAAEVILQVEKSGETEDAIARGQLWVQTECSLEHHARRIAEITGIGKKVV